MALETRSLDLSKLSDIHLEFSGVLFLADKANGHDGGKDGDDDKDRNEHGADHGDDHGDDHHDKTFQLGHHEGLSVGSSIDGHDWTYRMIDLPSELGACRHFFPLRPWDNASYTLLCGKLFFAVELAHPLSFLPARLRL